MSRDPFDIIMALIMAVPMLALSVALVVVILESRP